MNGILIWTNKKYEDLLKIVVVIVKYLYLFRWDLI